MKKYVYLVLVMLALILTACSNSTADTSDMPQSNQNLEETTEGSGDMSYTVNYLKSVN